MIILSDNKNFAKRHCEKEQHEHFCDGDVTQHMGEILLMADLGDSIFLSGDEAEKYLDEHNIYYIHIEAVKKESYRDWSKRLAKAIKERQADINANDSKGRVIFSLTEDYERGDAYTYNLIEVKRDNQDGRVYLTTSIVFDDLTTEEKGDALSLAYDMMARELGKWSEMYPFDPFDGEDFSTLLSAKTADELLFKVWMLSNAYKHMAEVREAGYGEEKPEPKKAEKPEPEAEDGDDELLWEECDDTIDDGVYVGFLII